MRECKINGDSVQTHRCWLMLQGVKKSYERHFKDDPMDDSIIGNIRRRIARDLYSHFIQFTDIEDIVVEWGMLCL